MITVAGFDITVGPERLLTGPERSLLDRLHSREPSAAGAPNRPRLRVHLTHNRPLLSIPDLGLELRQPSAVECHGRRVSISHRHFEATVDPFDGVAELSRRTEGAFPLDVTLRTALCCALPAAGGVPLHAAGAILGGWAIVFFGSSGAGKSTLASSCPYPVLSDELVVIRGRRWIAEATGSWGEGGPLIDAGGPTGAPLAAVVEIGRGTGFRIQRLHRRDALKRLLHVVKVPAMPALWTDALGQIERLIQNVPVFRMEWHREHPPWSELERMFVGPGGDSRRPGQTARREQVGHAIRS